MDFPTADALSDTGTSYIDYDTLLSPTFSAAHFVNTLLLATNNPTDIPLDLSTPLSRVLFDIQEIDSLIDALTRRSAVPLLSHTSDQTAASRRISSRVDEQVHALNDSYAQLEKEVLDKHAEADEVRGVAGRLCETLRLGRAVGRCLALGRQMEVQWEEMRGNGKSEKEDHMALVRCTNTFLALRDLLGQSQVPDAEGCGLDRVECARSLRTSLVEPCERSVRELAERMIREFSMGTAPASSAHAATTTLTYMQSEEIKARTLSAIATLWLLSLPPTATNEQEKWTPHLLLAALDLYLCTALQSSLAGLTRGLSTLPSLERALAEVSARCQNVCALETVLESARPPIIPEGLQHLAPRHTARAENMLQPLLAHLETGSLASYFWRSLASGVAGRVHDIVNKGGVSAKTLRTNKSGVADAIRNCVVRGSELPSGAASARGPRKSEGETKGWEREVAVMVGAVVGNLWR